MLRKIAAGTSAAVVAAGLAAAPAVAAGLAAPPGTAFSGGHPRDPPGCGDSAQTEQTEFEPPATQGFVFGPLADVPHLLSGDRSCFTVASTVTDLSAARRHSASPPPVGTPVPEVPSSPPPDASGPPPGPGDSGAPPPAGPAADTSSPPPAPDFTPTTPPAPVPPSPPPAPRSELGGPGESVLPPEAQPPAEPAPRLPQTASNSRPLTVAGGGSLIAAGLAWIGGARRRRKRPAGPAAED